MPHTRSKLRRVALTTTAVAAAASIGVLTAPTASADPAAQLPTAAASILDVATQALLENLPQASNGSIDLPSIFSLLPGTPNTPGAPRTEQAPGTTAPAGRQTTCQSVVHIGDSTSVGIDGANISTAADRLTPQYQSVGVKKVVLDALGGRSIVEKVNGEPNAVDAITAKQAEGNRGCWVISMGVNDAANIAVGSSVGADERIDRVMAKLTGQQVLWPTVMTGNPSNAAYASKNMVAFNDALKRAAARYPNLQVYDFAKDAQPGWYSDGIHYSEAGLVARNKLFAAALAAAFPK
ncbi:MAG: SGNH/GDSL hydrolase family protein [Gordonia sp.]|nr:SGNH/GDSL hydrolase family protein [Gordonia sp. (in: high G+C Gram-positive bacteria)]